MAAPDDFAGIEEWLTTHADGECLAIMCKSEGNGCTNDFSRTLAYSGFKSLFRRLALPEPVIVISGGTEGVLSPHATLFIRRPSFRVSGPEEPRRLTVGSAISATILCAEIGTKAQTMKVAEAVREAIHRARITDKNDIHFVQVKCPMLFDAASGRRDERGKKPPVTFDAYESMAYSRGASALGVAVAVGEIGVDAIKDNAICRDYQLFSRVASISSGAEMSRCEVIVLGNSCYSRSAQTIKSTVMEHPADIGAALTLSAEIKRQNGALIQILAKADPAATVLGNRTTMLSDSDIHPTRHARAAVGGLLVGVFQDNLIYVSGGAEHQGPPGGGVLAAIWTL